MIKQASHPNYEIDLDTIKKVFVIEVKGFMKPEGGMSFVKDFNHIINKINSYDYTLVVDPETLETSSQDMLPILKGCFELYKGCNFKKVLMITPSSSTSALQLKKVQQEIGVTMDFVPSNPF